MNKILLVGHGGRESAFAKNLCRDSAVYALAGHVNPTIARCCEESGGQLVTGSVEDGRLVAEMAKSHGIDYAFVNADGPLSQGVVDSLTEAGIKTIGPTRAGSRIEWDKIYSIRLVEELFPQYCPRFFVAQNAQQAHEAVTSLCADGTEVVIKPQGLTGGKGVKVMGEHLADAAEATAYAESLLRADADAPVLVTEKLDGIEFTLMGITDGISVVGTPATYDYPYRLAGDRGPGTGGMGCFTDSSQPAFFLEQHEYQACLDILTGVVRRLTQMGAHFSGVLNGGFFLTRRGLYFMEFNARIGDPEGVNILALMQSPFSRLLADIHAQRLHADSFELDSRASVVKYLVTPDYPAAGDKLTFSHDTQAFADVGVESYFASAAATGTDNQFATVSSSRILALSAVDDTIVQAAERINQAIETLADKQLHFRADIGLTDNLSQLSARAARIRSSA
ncbi:MAG: hypothetical protein K8963_03530 [Proteobacteria bacterium]|nr:hypothetical protein [Pseudomonadota bacterium]